MASAPAYGRWTSTEEPAELEPAAAGSARRASLVILDDDALVCDLVAAVAELSSYEATSVQTFEAFKTVLAQCPAPSVIVLDLGIGDADGVSVLRHLRDRACVSSILVMSGCDARVIDTAVSFGRSLGLDMLAPLPKPFDPERLSETLAQHASARSALTPDDAAGAIARGEFAVHLQPVISIRTRQPIGAEALIRWNHPTRGLVFPDQFIPQCETDPVMLPLTLEVARLAIESVVGLPGEPSLAINVPPICLANQHFPDQLVEIVFKNRLRPSRLTVEVTETAAMADPAFTAAQVTRLRIKGFQVALDDFGVGHSTLVELHRMPVSVIKIDRSFVRVLRDDRTAQAIARSIVGLGRSMELEVVAEGVEDAETLELLRAFGCEFAQGYHIAKPMPAEEFPRWLATWPARLVHRQ